MPNHLLYGSAVLIWLPPDADPRQPDFSMDVASAPPDPNPEPWWRLSDAVRYACTLDHDTGKIPWIKAGEDLLGPKEIREMFEGIGSI
ncbi:hypothetical protein [Terrihabitans sp. B22-R8]|uniref:hypothetical protein n=1 Tax=Terrihabitans sp. B22-R8 TaxID=3425128 RepID=UPI00403C6C41